MHRSRLAGSGLHTASILRKKDTTLKKMKLHILSDLHLEFADFSKPTVEADMAILAGDIHLKGRGVSWASYAFTSPVIYVMGNHEHYGGNLDRTHQKLVSAASGHVHVLENQSLSVDNVQFLCATAWTDFSATGNRSAAVLSAREVVTDFRTIRTGPQFRRIRPEDLAERNRVTKAWLTSRLSEPFSGKRVVVTHHAPLMRFVRSDKGDPHARAADGNNWDDLLFYDVDLWVFGHTHEAVDQWIGKTRFVSNPKGYPGEETGFRGDLVISL